MAGLISQRRFPHGRAVALFAPADSGPVTLFSDDFTRDDSATTLGDEWTVAGSLLWGIDGNRAYAPTASGLGIATVDAGAADVDVTVDVQLRAGVTTVSRGAPLVRCDGTTDNRWMVLMDSGNTLLRLIKTVAGTDTTVKSTAFQAVLGTVYTLRVVVNADSGWSVWVDGVEMTGLRATDSTHSTLTSHGLATSRGASTTLTDIPHFDNFAVRPA